MRWLLLIHLYITKKQRAQDNALWHPTRLLTQKVSHKRQPIEHDLIGMTALTLVSPLKPMALAFIE